jgi:LEA14-like dessication related protein
MLVEMKKIFYSAYICAMAVGIVCSCKAPKDLVYQGLQDVKMQKDVLKKGTITLNLRFYNPNRYKISVKDGLLDVYMNSNHAGTASVAPCTIPANDTFALPVTVNLDIKNVVTNAFALLADNEPDVKVTGHVVAGRHGVFITVPVDYEGKQNILQGQ